MFNKKIYFSYEYGNEKEHLEADYSAHRVDSYGYCYHPRSHELHGSQCVFLIGVRDGFELGLNLVLVLV